MGQQSPGGRGLGGQARRDPAVDRGKLVRQPLLVREQRSLQVIARADVELPLGEQVGQRPAAGSLGHGKGALAVTVGGAAQQSAHQAAVRRLQQREVLLACLGQAGPPPQGLDDPHGLVVTGDGRVELTALPVQEGEIDQVGDGRFRVGHASLIDLQGQARLLQRGIPVAAGVRDRRERAVHDRDRAGVGYLGPVDLQRMPRVILGLREFPQVDRDGGEVVQVTRGLQRPGRDRRVDVQGLQQHRPRLRELTRLT